MYRVVYTKFIWNCSRETFFTSSWGGGAYHPWDLKTLFVSVRRKRSILKESRPPPSYGTIHDYLDIEDGFSLLGNV